MSFNPIALAGWKRRTHYEHYMAAVRCTYSVTVNIDVHDLLKKVKALGLKAYPVQIYLLARTVNSFEAFRMALNPQGQVGYWDITHPSYTIFNKATETFSSIYTPFHPDFTQFYEQCQSDMKTYGSAEVLFPQADMPENLFTISSLPWLAFTGFNLNVHGEGTYLPPIFTLGRYGESHGKTHVPLSIQVHHGVCDGYHVGQFTQALQELAAHHHTWL